MTAWNRWRTVDPSGSLSSPVMQQVTTDCLYPGGRHVVVSVQQREGTFTLSDEGAGWYVLNNAGFEPGRPASQRAAQTTAEQWGVRFVQGSFTLDDILSDQIDSALVHVANASQAWVRSVFDRRTRGSRPLADRAVPKLTALFGPSLERDVQVLGQSTRAHQLAFLLPLECGRTALIEPVASRLGSVASTYLKFADIGRLHPDWPREALVENLGSWDSADLTLLAEVATGITDLDENLTSLSQRLGA